MTVAAATLSLAGCGVGQVSQVASQQAAINGVSGSTGSIQLRNAHLRGSQELDAIKPPSEVELLLVAVNMSPDTNDRLMNITSEYGEVDITGDREVPASRSLIIGVPDGVPEGVQALEGATQAEATVTLTKPISNGVTYKFTFEFQNAGTTDLYIPLDAGQQPRLEEGGGAEQESSGGHH
ncbi:MAG: hypothetical protein ACSLE6_10465 [Mycobacterium sp.]